MTKELKVLRVFCSENHPKHLVAKIYPRDRWTFERKPQKRGLWDMPFNTPATQDLPAAFDAEPLTFKYSVACQICRTGEFVQVNGNQLRDIVWQYATRQAVMSLTIPELHAILTSR